VSDPRIYIAIATFHPLVGGAERQALLQGRGLRKRGYEATIITFHHDKTWPSRELIEGVPVMRVAGMLLGGREKLPRLLQKLLYLMALVVMGWALWRYRRCYDILHVYQLTLLTLPTALVCRLTGKPMVIGVRCIHSGKSEKFSGKLSLIAGPIDAAAVWLQVHERIRLAGDLEDLERLGKTAVRLIRSLLQRIQAVVVLLSSQMKSYLTAHDFNLPGVQLIPNGVDITRFTPSDGGTFRDERAQVVVCVARLCYQKGIDVLLQAWYLVHEQAPQARLIIVGTGPLRNQLECMANTLSIAESVEFAGLQSDVVAQLYRGSLAVHPSRWEGMANAILEAMACGLPCVATRVSGSEDIIQHGVNGLLVEPEDYRDMARALLTLLRDQALAQMYGQTARATIEERFSLEHIMDTYIELYQSIAAHRCSIARRRD
jgi:glycosyltransferase involved in cell wall biosynthesis